jgi:hypothetical protein
MYWIWEDEKHLCALNSRDIQAIYEEKLSVADVGYQLGFSNIRKFNFFLSPDNISYIFCRYRRGKGRFCRPFWG